MNAAKYKAFGKIKFRNSVKANNEVLDLQKKKSNIMEKNNPPNEELEELEKKIKLRKEKYNVVYQKV